MSSDLERTAAALRARYGALLTPAPATGDPSGEARAALTAAADRLRGPDHGRLSAAQLTFGDLLCAEP